MHDIRAIREDRQTYIDGWARRGVADSQVQVDHLLTLDAGLRQAQTALQGAQSRRNELSKLIGAAKAQRDEATAALLMEDVETLKGDIETANRLEGDYGRQLKDQLAKLPNLAAEGVPHGADENANVKVSAWGDPASIPASRLNAPVDHATLGERMGLMDFERAARMSGSRFVALKGGLARMERALGQFMLDLQTREHGYTEVSPPLLVRDEAMFGTGQLPKFADDLFGTEAKLLVSHGDEAPDGPYLAGTSMWVNRASDAAFALTTVDIKPERWLIPTAEVSLTNLVREEITPAEQLPLRMTALTPSFRSEAGASGRDTRGMIRQHQFYKVELVSITEPDASNDEHERMTTCAEEVLKRLGLPFRRMLLCDGDMGFSARRTYDLEVWLASEGRYREISSCSNCGDFQARRMDARTKTLGEKGSRFVHTLNGSGLAVGRTLVAVMEAYQDEGGRVAVPEALLPYMGGVTHVPAA